MSASISKFQPIYETIENEGASLKVWHQGNGLLVILIPGGGGTGESFNESMPNLSQHYKVVTYDRRGNGQSTVAKPRILNPMESARDVIAIIKALGYATASLFGTSSGGLVALQLAQSYPEYVESIVVHEVPITSILPEENIKRVDSGYVVFQTYMEKGAEAALQLFRSSITGKPVEPSPSNVFETVQPAPHRLDYFFRYEFIIFITYTPNLRLIRDCGIPIATVQGLESRGVFHARSAEVQSEILKCLHVVWPGGHSVYQTQPEVFSEKLHKTLQTLQGKAE